jgi:hypothetical protein
MAGLDYLQAMIDGSLPPPPMGQLMRFDIVSAEPGRVVFTCEPDESAYNPSAPFTAVLCAPCWTPWRAITRCLAATVVSSQSKMMWCARSSEPTWQCSPAAFGGSQSGESGGRCRGTLQHRGGGDHGRGSRAPESAPIGSGGLALSRCSTVVKTRSVSPMFSMSWSRYSPGPKWKCRV